MGQQVAKWTDKFTKSLTIVHVSAGDGSALSLQGEIEERGGANQQGSEKDRESRRRSNGCRIHMASRMANTRSVPVARKSIT